MEKIIKHRLFTWFEEGDSPVAPGQKVLTERIAHLGEKVDITNPVHLKRGEELGAFYTDEEAKAIEDGTYNGFDREALMRARGGQFAGPNPVEAADGEHTGDVAALSAPDLAIVLKPSKFGGDGKDLNLSETLALVPENADAETLQKFIDAENIATDNDPRAGVLDALEARQAKLES